MYLKKLLEEWNLQKSVKKIKENHVRYFYDLGCIDFVSVKGDGPHEFFEVHCELWCENKTDIIVFVSEKGDITVCDPKVKPSKKHKKSIIVLCDQEMEPSAYVALFQKNHIDSGKCINTIQKLARKEIRRPIDTDLVKTLVSCVHKISECVQEENREEIAYTIVDCCVLIRFLEDKLNKNNLKKVLEQGDINDLEKLFYSYRNIIPGCVIDIPRNSAIIEILGIFGVNSVYTFKRTPVKVFSNIYGHVLSKRENTKCIPANVVEYMVDNLLGTYPDTKIKENQMKILNFACGSGIFLVTLLEKIIEKRKGHAKVLLQEKIQLAQMLYGAAQNRNSFRIAMVCLYLKLVEGEPVSVVKKFFDNLCDLNIKEGDLVTNPFCDEFDIIVGNSVQIPSLNTSHQDITRTEKWADVQCSFLLHIKKWMNPKTVCGIIAPLRYFTLKRYKKFREKFLQKYGLLSFTNFSKIMPQDTMCYLYFGTASESIKFCTPEPHYFFNMTSTITEDNKVIAHSAILKENDHLWPVFAQGFHTYLEIIHILDCSTYCLTDYFVREKSKVTKKEHIIPHMVREDTVPYIPTEKESDFKGKYLFITKEWPIKAVISSAYENPHFWMYKLKSGFPDPYLLLFETILNSQLIKFYYEIKNYVKEGIPVEKEHLDQLPVPDLEEGWGTKELVEKFVKSVEMGTSSWELFRTNNKNTFVLDLYDIYTYDIRKIEHYYMDKNRHVTEKDMRKYCTKVIDSLHPFVRDGFNLIAEWATSEFFGTMVKFSASKDDTPFQYNTDLEQFIQIIEDHENVERKDIFKEKKIRFYGNNCIYIYKSNKLKDWTEFMAILDGNKEIHLIFLNPEE